MLEWLQSAWPWLFRPAIAVAAVVWLGKVWTERAIDRRFRDWEFRFSTFHVRLVDAMEVIRRVLAEANAAIASYQVNTSAYWGVGGTDAMEAALDGLRKARFELQCRQFYFDPETRQIIEGVVELLTKTAGDARAVFLTGGGAQPQETTDFVGRIQKTSKELETAKNELDERFGAIVRGKFESYR